MSGFDHYGAIPELAPRTFEDPQSERGAVLHRVTLEALRPEDTEPAAPPKPALVSSGPGRIMGLAVTVPRYATGDSVLGQIYRDLFGQVGENRQLVIAAPEDAVKEVYAWAPDKDATRIAPIPAAIKFSAWAQDSCCMARAADGKRYALEPVVPPRRFDGLVTQHIAKRIAYEQHQSPLFFRGGNLLAGDEFLLVGKDLLIANDGTNAQPEFVRAKFERHLDGGREVIFVGTKEKDEDASGEMDGHAGGSYQPIFHLDMFITLAGPSENEGCRYRLMVGDPRLAAQTLGEPAPESLALRFDEIAEFLRSERFEVVRNPLPLVRSPGSGRRYFASSNNALVEHDAQGVGTVWLPTYGYGPFEALKETDEANRAIWADLGFEVQQLTNYHPLAEKLGAVHCITNYLEREGG